MNEPHADNTAFSHMPLWKRVLLAGYYHATLPARWQRARARVQAGNAPVMIVFYHRVADDVMNDWTMPTRLFRRQVNYFRTHFDVVSLQEAQRRIQSGFNARPAVSITFDDGYADNCLNAIPLLVKDGIPCTYFVSTRHVLDGMPFPHDVSAGRPLPPNAQLGSLKYEMELSAVISPAVALYFVVWVHGSRLCLYSPQIWLLTPSTTTLRSAG